ncbi:hypothetical protein D3C85_860030 [compost metagenome]
MPAPDKLYNSRCAVGTEPVVRIKQQIRPLGVTDDPVEMVDQLIMVLFGQIDCPDFVDQCLKFRCGVFLE